MGYGDGEDAATIRVEGPSVLQAIDALTEPQIEELHRLYQQEWWTKGRQVEDVRRMLRCSDLVFGFCEVESRRLVAFARVLTDYVYKALVFDVIVAASYRKTGLGRELMNAVVSHPRLGGVRHLELYCLPELVPFYEKWGFTTNLGGLHFLRRMACGSGSI